MTQGKQSTLLYDALVEFDLPGGPAVHTMNVIKGFQELGWNVVVAAPQPHQNKSLRVQLLSVYFRGFEMMDLLIYEILLLSALCFHCLNKKPDFILHRERMYSFASILASKIFRIPLYIDSNGPAAEDYETFRKQDDARSAENESAKSKIGNHFRTYWRRFELGQASGFFSNTTYWAEAMSMEFSYPEVRTRVVSMLVDHQKFYAMDKLMCREKLGLPKETLILGYVGTFQPTHELDLMFDSVRSLNQAGIPAMLVLAGGGNRCEELKTKYQSDSYARWMGWVHHSDLPVCINAFDIGLAFLKPEKAFAAEAFLKIKEYLACGIPVILSPCEERLFQDYPNRAISVLESLTPEEVVRSVKEILGDVQSGRRRQGQYESFIKERYSLCAGAKEMADFMRQTAGKSKC